MNLASDDQLGGHHAKAECPAHLSQGYWLSLSDVERELYLRIRPQPDAAYTCDVSLSSLENWLESQAKDLADIGGSLELHPDYQRGHVWSMQQRIEYMESFIRGQAPKLIMFNCPGYMSMCAHGDVPANTMQCIDGLQRLTSVRMFLRGEIGVFGGLTSGSMKGTSFDPRRLRLQVAIYEFRWRRDLLQFYLDLNGGGTPHPQSELVRVRALMASAAPRTGELAKADVSPTNSTHNNMNLTTHRQPTPRNRTQG